MRRKTLRKPYQVKKRKSILKNRFFWRLVLVLVIGLAIFYFLFFSSVFQIKNIKISGNKKVLTKDIEKKVSEKIENRILFLKTKSIFLVDFKEISKALLEEFPKIRKVDLARDFPNALGLKIQERKPAFLFCNSECFLIDKKGVIFERTENIETLSIIKFQEPEKMAFSLGEKIFEEDFLSKILEIKKRIKERLQIEIKEFIVSKEKLTAKSAQGWQIYFNLKGDIDWQLTELILILEKQIPSERRDELEYIDLRFSRVYYKYR